jgi:hypothetical protein
VEGVDVFFRKLLTRVQKEAEVLAIVSKMTSQQL